MSIINVNDPLTSPGSVIFFGVRVRDSKTHDGHICCSPLPILYPCPGSIAIIACLSPCFSVLCGLWVELVLSQIAPHSVHPSQSGPSPRSLPSHLHCCYLVCNVTVVSPHHMTIPRKAFLGDIIVCVNWLDHCIAPELFISDSVFPCFALNPS